MKRYIVSTEEHNTARTNISKSLLDRFIAYCRNAKCSDAEARTVSGMDWALVTGVRTSRLRSLAASFVKMLKANGEDIDIVIRPDSNMIEKIQFTFKSR